MKKRYVISIITILLITLSFFAYNIFSNKQEIVGSKSIAIYLQDENNENNYVLSELNTIPTDGYTFNVEKTNSLCSDATFSYSNNNISVSTFKTIKCNLYFDLEINNFTKNILQDHGTRCTVGGTCTCTTGTTCASTTPTARSSFSVNDTQTYTNTLYSTNETQDASTVYYFAGNTQDNWVRFANNGNGTCYYWRIIRTNENGGVRLLYSGSSTSCTSSVPVMTNAYINNTTYPWATSDNKYNNSSYSGYMYTLNEQHGNTTDSYAKTIVDAWYVSSGLANFSSYLDNDAIYCSDREVKRGDTWSATGNSFTYGMGTRFLLDYTNSYKCTNILDSYSVNNNSAKLTYPIALMTVEEAGFAGAIYGSEQTTPLKIYFNYASNNTSISTNNNNWYLLSAYSWNKTLNSFYVNSIWYTQQNSKYAGSIKYVCPPENIVINGVLRPVISLKANIKWASGDGSVNSPYRIVEN